MTDSYNILYVCAKETGDRIEDVRTIEAIKKMVYLNPIFIAYVIVMGLKYIQNKRGSFPLFLAFML